MEFANSYFAQKRSPGIGKLEYFICQIHDLNLRHCHKNLIPILLLKVVQSQFFLIKQVPTPYKMRIGKALNTFNNGRLRILISVYYTTQLWKILSSENGWIWIESLRQIWEKGVRRGVFDIGLELVASSYLTCTWSKHERKRANIELLWSRKA